MTFSSKRLLAIAVTLGLGAHCLGGYCLGGYCLGAHAHAQNWPQWRGPERDGHAADFVAPRAWPEELEPLWRKEVGAGYSSPVVAAGKIYIHSREGDEEIVSSLAVSDGKFLWRARYSAPYNKNSYALSHGEGPNSTPVISGGQLFTLGMSGILSAFRAESGRLLWRHDHSARVTTKKLFCGTSASPIVDQGLVLAHLGDDQAGEFLAFDAASGKVEWTWSGTGPGYASPVVVDLAGTRQVVTMTQNSVIGLDTKTGRPHLLEVSGTSKRVLLRGPTCTSCTMPVLTGALRPVNL